MEGSARQVTSLCHLRPQRSRVAAGLQHHDLGMPVVVLGERVHLKVAEQSTEGDVSSWEMC